jgi:hypothetical protein
MYKLKFKLVLLCFLTLTSSCSLKTSIKGEFLLENSYRLIKEFIEGVECSAEESLFLTTSKLYVHKDETFDLSLKYKTEQTLELNGTYKLYVGDVGHSGDGYIVIDGIEIPLTFENSYFLIFDLPTKYNYGNNNEIHTLRFQRW